MVNLKFIGVVFGSLILNVSSSQYDFPLGCVIDTVNAQMQHEVVDEFTRGSGLPSVFSLKKWAPDAGMQKLPNCTSWASAYAAMTIAKSVESGVKQGAFSPLCLFNRYKIKFDEPHCDDSRGSVISWSLEILKDKGCEPFAEHPTCSRESSYKVHSDKIFDYQKIATDIRTIKNRISKSQPVVIAFESHRKYVGISEGWQDDKNFINGVWNGYSKYWNVTGGHAMCVVGYDDNKAGGAFEIMNSWGTTWGNAGFFWVKYSDFIKVCSEAYAVIPQNVNSTDEGNTIEKIVFKPTPTPKPKPNPTPTPEPSPLKKSKKLAEGVFGANVKFINSCTVPIYISIAQNSGRFWTSEGWYKLETNTSKTLDISDRKKNEFYWMASNNVEKLYWHNKFTNNDNSFCINPTQRFDYSNARYKDNMRSDDCNNKMGFIQITPPKKSITIVQEIGCTEYANRGGGIELMPIVIEEIIEEQTGVSEDGEYFTQCMIFDRYTGNIIQPNREGNYTVFELNDDKLTEVNIPYTECEQIQNRIFFTTEQNGLNYIELD